MLERLGYEVVAFQSALKAREYLLRTDKPVHLLIADVMPGLDGVALAHEAAQIRPGIRVLLISGHPNPLPSAGLPLKQAMFLQKPFSLESLARKVRETLDTRWS